MNEKIDQKNFFGDNMVNSTKKIINKYRTQGFIAGVLISIIATIIYEYLIKPIL